MYLKPSNCHFAQIYQFSYQSEIQISLFKETNTFANIWIIIIICYAYGWFFRCLHSRWSTCSFSVSALSIWFSASKFVHQMQFFRSIWFKAICYGVDTHRAYNRLRLEHLQIYQCKCMYGVRVFELKWMVFFIICGK